MSPARPAPIGIILLHADQYSQCDLFLLSIWDILLNCFSAELAVESRAIVPRRVSLCRQGVPLVP